MPATGSGEMFCQPVKGLFHDDSGALGGEFDMGPRADGQTYIYAAAPQTLVLFDHLINEPILLAFLQQDGDVDPVERLTQPHRLPKGSSASVDVSHSRYGMLLPARTVSWGVELSDHQQRRADQNAQRGENGRFLAAGPWPRT